MTSKHDILTENDIKKIKLPSAVLEGLKALEKIHDIKDIRVLDVGCGRGALVLYLNRLGYSAFGLEIDADVVKNGSKIFHDSGLNINDKIKVISLHNDRWGFQENYFDLIISDQVLEHVEDLSHIARECARVMKASGMSFHFLPAKWTVFEPHLYVPFVHWLPKNRLRYFLIRFLMPLVNFPSWRGHESLSRRQQAEEFYQYLNKKTYYRSPASIKKIFNKSSIEINEINCDMLKPTALDVKMGFLVKFIQRNFISLCLAGKKKRTKDSSATVGKV